MEPQGDPRRLHFHAHAARIGCAIAFLGSSRSGGGAAVEQKTGHGSHDGKGSYLRLSLLAVLSFLAMYGLMYAMVDKVSNVFHNLNQVYMAGLMAAPMVIIELLVMWSMYPDRKANAAILAVSAAAVIAFWFAIRGQAGITERQFLRSMIPHHAGALLMCGQAEFRDAELRLCARRS